MLISKKRNNLVSETITNNHQKAVKHCFIAFFYFGKILISMLFIDFMLIFVPLLSRNLIDDKVELINTQMTIKLMMNKIEKKCDVFVILK